ncbi:hypothetical protein OU995_11765 [Roseateles sp. SL47]|uniref:hypothetical protein n=1 Tax=Roseateles sp. SL47 TaxID=2995138 RepID=UPI0022716F8D|nr:hypothetical protein [Roseateles sp. SL47]WAC75325.1 hypothetical protein OU995_11765 [Roseateles sp. SL47]
MEVTTLQEDLAAETAALNVLVGLVNEQHGNYIQRMAEAAAEPSFTNRFAILQRALDAKTYRDTLQVSMDRQAGRVRAIRLAIEDERLQRVVNLHLHDRLQQIAPTPNTPEAA